MNLKQERPGQTQENLEKSVINSSGYCINCKIKLSHIYNKRCKKCLGIFRKLSPEEKKLRIHLRQQLYYQRPEVKKRRREYLSGWRKKNIERIKKSEKLYKLSHPEGHKANSLKYAYGATLEEYYKLMHRAKNKCEVCGKRSGRLRQQKLNLDHNHATKKLRGILCGSCNRGLGYFKDSIVLLQKMIKYLKLNDNKEEEK